MRMTWTCRIPASFCGPLCASQGKDIANAVEKSFSYALGGAGQSSIGVLWTWGTLQERVQDWLTACFGKDGTNVRERAQRFFEEAGELCQAAGMPADDAYTLVSYVWGRPKGEVKQEVGGTMITLAALCQFCGVDMDDAGEVELTRVWAVIDRIRAKQASKRAMFTDNTATPLPGLAVDFDKLLLAASELGWIAAEYDKHGNNVAAASARCRAYELRQLWGALSGKETS